MKRLSLTILVLVLLTVLAGHVFAEGTQETSSEDDRMTISIAPYRRSPTEPDGKIILHFEDMYNVDFDIWNVEADRYAELMGIRFASGEIPDVMDIRTDTLTRWYEQGVLAEIPVDFLKEHAPLSYEANVEMEPNFLRPGMIDGKLYSLQEVPPTDIRYPAAVWRGDWLEAVGIDSIPETLDEFEEAVYAIANEDPDGNGVKDTYGISNMGMQSVYGAFGLAHDKWFKDGNGGLVHGAVHPDMKRALEILARWYDDGVIDPEFITGENTGGYWALSHAFINGRIGYTNQGGYTHWYPPLTPGGQGGANYNELAKIDVGAANSIWYGVPPEGPDGKYGIFFAGEAKRIVANVITAFGVQLEDDTEKFARVLNVLDQIKSSSFESYLTSRFGFEGEDYIINDRGQVEPIGQAAEDANYIESQGGGWAFRFFDNPQFANQVDPVLRNWALEHNYGRRIAKHELLVGLPSEGRYLAELNKIRDEAFVAIVTGDRPVSYFDTFVEEWYDAGGDTLTEEATAWYRDFWNLDNGGTEPPDYWK